MTVLLLPASRVVITLLASWLFFGFLNLRTRRWRQCFPPKRRTLRDWRHIPTDTTLFVRRLRNWSSSVAMFISWALNVETLFPPKRLSTLTDIVETHSVLWSLLVNANPRYQLLTLKMEAVRSPKRRQTLPRLHWATYRKVVLSFASCSEVLALFAPG